MTIDEKRNDKGQLVGWKVRVCVGREGNKQKWKTLSIKADDPAFGEVDGNGKKADKARADILKRMAIDFEKAAKDEFTIQQEAKGKNPDAVVLDKRKITLSQYVHTYWWPDVLKTRRNGKPLRPNTLSFYKYTSDNICKYFDSLPKAQQRLYKMDARAVKDFINYLRADAVGEDGEPLSETTVLRHWQTFRNIINAAIRDEYIMRDPCLKLKESDKPSSKQTTPQPNEEANDHFTREEARRFIALLDEKTTDKDGIEQYAVETQWRALMNIFIQHGLRRGEAIGLRWKDIKAETIDGKQYHTIDIRNSVTPDAASKDKRHVDDPKTDNSTRTIIIQPEVYAMLMELKSKRENDLGIIISPKAESYVFCSCVYEEDKGRKKLEYRIDIPMYPSSPTRWLSRFAAKHNIKNVSPHDLRRTWATLANEAGVNAKAIKYNLGHSDGNDVTNRHYIKMTLAGQINTLEIMHTVFYGDSKGNNGEQKQA